MGEIQEILEEMQEILDICLLQIATFAAGFISGFAVFRLEFLLFLGTTIIAALHNSFPINEASESIYLSYKSAIANFTIAGFIQGILIGILLTEAFSFGYIIGVFVSFILFVDSLLNIAPSVFFGMAMAIFAVLIGIIIRFSIKNRRKNSYTNYW
jgi:hypothetical protein